MGNMIERQRCLCLFTLILVSDANKQYRNLKKTLMWKPKGKKKIVDPFCVGPWCSSSFQYNFNLTLSKPNALWGHKRISQKKKRTFTEENILNRLFELEKIDTLLYFVRHNLIFNSVQFSSVTQ